MAIYQWYSALVEVAIVASMVVDTVNRANEAIEGGRPYEAAGIVVGSCSNLAITFLGGEALTEVLLPYFTGAGMAIAGPAGAIFGGLIAGVIGFGTSTFVGGLVDDLVEGFFGLLDDLFSDAGTAVRYVADPLVIDLDGNGFELLSLADGVYFNVNAEGLREKTQWVMPNDALLAIDLNGDGIINDGSELFGTSTVLADGSKAKSGFEALAQYDENGDGIIDEKDAAYSQMLVWRDRNSDGVSQEEELVSLQEAGIQSISLTHYDEDGRQVAGITFHDGRTSKIGEFNFEAQLYNTKEIAEIEISEEIKALANVRSIGNVASLHTMMQADESGTLKNYVEAFAQAETTEQKEELLTKILYRITGAENVTSNSRGGQFDAQKLAVIEAFMGRDFVGTAGSNPVNTAATILEGVYSDIHEIYYNLLNAETALKDYLGMTFWIKDENGNRYLDTSFFYAYVDYCRKEGNDMISAVADMGRYIAAINAKNGGNYADYLLMYEDNHEYYEAIKNYCPNTVLLGTNKGETLRANNRDSYLLGMDGNDYLYGGNGNDRLYGEAGNDSLYGGAGDDHLEGGEGNDYLNGGEGKDVYHFGLGWGKDRINNYDMGDGRIYDCIEFGEGIHAEDLRFIRNGNDLLITHKTNGDQIEVDDAYLYTDGRYFLEKIRFSDGIEWGLKEIAERVAEAVGAGSEGDDSLSGYGDSYGYSRNETFHGGAGNDTINGNDGNDILYGEEGNDSLYGGTGNDYLSGGEGKDIYHFELGWGKDRISNYDTGSGRIHDRIEFGEGVHAEDLHLNRKGNDLIITHKPSGDQIEVSSAYWYSDGRYFLERIGFSDGIEWGLEEIAERVAEAVGAGSEGDDSLSGYGDSYGYSRNETFHGGAGNDTINGNDGNDILYGEEGNDSLYGGYGDDILDGGTGNDYLNGGEGKDIYHFELGWGMDTIYNYDLSNDRLYDRIEFGMGIYAKDLALARKSNDLVITRTESGDTITIRDAYYYADERCQIENVTFSDGTKGIIDYDCTEIVLEEPAPEESAADMESLTDSGAALLTNILTAAVEDAEEPDFLEELSNTDSIMEDIDINACDRESSEEAQDNIGSNEDVLPEEEIMPDEMAAENMDGIDVEKAADAGAAMLEEVLAADTADEDIASVEDFVLADIMAEDNSSNVDESTDLQVMLLVQELSASEDNNICSNDMEDNIYEMPLFTEQFAVAE